MRGIETSSTATSGRAPGSTRSAATPSCGLGHHLHVELAVDQHAQARADDAVVVGDQDADHCRHPQRDGRPAARRRAHVELAADQPGALGHPDQPEAAAVAVLRAARSAGRSPLPSSRTRSSASPSLPLELQLDDGRARVARHVGERLLGDAVDRRLHDLRQRVGVAAGVEPHLDAGARREALELGLDRRHQPVVVERRRAQLAREVEQLVHRLVDEPLELGDLGRRARAGSPARAPPGAAGSRSAPG